jgi:YHS domain-containing protein
MKNTYFLIAFVIVILTGINAQPSRSHAYPLDICIVSGQKLGTMGAPVIYKHKEHEIRFCCKACIPTFQKSISTYLEKINNAIIEQQLPYYPVEICLVTGEKLGEMGAPVHKVYRNRLLRFCCKGCFKQFAKSSEKYLAQLDEAIIEKEKPTYPLATCVVSRQKLGGMGTPVDFVHGGRLVRFCCRGCIAKFVQEPLKYMALLKPKENHKGHEHAKPHKEGCGGCGSH